MKAKVRGAIAAGLSMLLLASCGTLEGKDSFYGLTRQARLPGMPSLDCVEASIRAVPDLGAYRFRQGSDAHRWQILPSDHLYFFDFYPAIGSRIGGEIMIDQEYNGDVLLQESVLYDSRTPSRDTLAASRNAFIAIEANIAEHCGVPDLATRISETCTGDSCNPPAKI